MMVARGHGELFFNSIEFQFCKIKDFRRWTVVISALQYECTKYHSTVHLKMVKTVNFMCILQLKKWEKI